MSKKYKVWIFWALMLIGALLVVSQSSYSDGDDAFFYQYTNSMGFGEYLSWRYQTWVGRMSGEAFVYLAFRLGLGFWRVVNAVMLVLLPMGVLRLSEKAAGIGVHSEEAIGPCAAAVGGYFLMNIMTVGYGLGEWFHLLYLVFYLRNLGADAFCGRSVRKAGGRACAE
mgnify:CR=1 FL=1